MRKDVFKAVGEKLIASIENCEKWKQPFSFRLSASAVTGKNYRGVNLFILAIAGAEKGYRSPFWLTWKQSNDLGARVRKGEKSTAIVYYLISYIDPATGGYLTREQFLAKYGSIPDFSIESRCFPRMHNVFNIEQIEGLSDDFLASLKHGENCKIETGEEFINSIAATIIPGLGDKAYYDQKNDTICLPPIDCFIDSPSYYHVAFHELIHWTGHPQRLNRVKGKVFGDEAYAMEELVAETGAAFLCQSLNMENNFDMHGGYLKSWLKSLKKDANQLFSVFPKAQEAAEYLLKIAGEKREISQHA